MRATRRTEAASETATALPIYRQKRSKVPQILFHWTWEFPLRPTYATAPPVPVAEAITPSISCKEDLAQWVSKPSRKRTIDEEQSGPPSFTASRISKWNSSLAEAQDLTMVTAEMMSVRML